MFKNLRLIYITTKDRDEAREIGTRLIREKLAACINILDGMESIYEWEGEVQFEKETVLIAKAAYHNVGKLTRLVKEMHSYDCPAILSLTITEQEGNEAYLDWLLRQSKPHNDPLTIDDADTPNRDVRR